MKRYPKIFRAILLPTLLLTALSSWAASTAGPGKDADIDPLQLQKFTFQVHNASIQSVAELIAQKAALELELGTGVNGRVTFALHNQTLLDALRVICEKLDLTYEVNGRVLTLRSNGKEGGSTAAGAERPVTDRAPASSGNIHSIQLRYSTAETVAGQIHTFIKTDEHLFPELTSNSIVFQGSDATYARITEMIRYLDVMPQQILIDAQVVETTRNFLDALGFSYGVTEDASLTNTAKTSGVVSFPAPTSPNIAGKYNIGTIGGTGLNVKIAAAESSGKAKVVTRPKVVTLNNNPAHINSGTSLFVKTLSPLLSSAGSSGGLSSVTGGVTTLNAGLTLNVTPTVMGNDMIRLKIDLNNSQPDESTTVDGIPGISSNAATTTVIVGQGRTAVIAGLIKNNKSHSENGVPLLSSIPVLGYLFKNFSDSDRNDELVIFITPHLVTPENDLRANDTRIPSDKRPD